MAPAEFPGMKLTRRLEVPLAPSARLDAWLPDAPFRDAIIVESTKDGARRAERDAGAVESTTHVSN
jgi:hypothetical protein